MKCGVAMSRRGMVMNGSVALCTGEGCLGKY